MPDRAEPAFDGGVDRSRPAGGLDRRRGLPLWRQLRDEVRRRLEAGEFAAAFPGELAFAREYRVSRATVRQALAELRSEGAVVAERGRQPRVAAHVEIEQPLGALYSLFASVEAAGQRQASTVRTLDLRRDPVVAARLGVEATTELLYLDRVRYADDEPLALDRTWLPASIAAPLLEADFTHTALYAELQRRTGVRLDAGDEEIRAVRPTQVERSLLRCPVGTAVLSIHRLGRAGGVAVEWRHSIVRGDRFALTAHFSEHGGYRLGARP
ncbi:MAG: GntR family transcriptional regulator [Candidatus Dormiibacterota bacterium]